MPYYNKDPKTLILTTTQLGSGGFLPSYERGLVVEPQGSGFGAYGGFRDVDRMGFCPSVHRLLGFGKARLRVSGSRTERPVVKIVGFPTRTLVSRARPPKSQCYMAILPEALPQTQTITLAPNPLQGSGFACFKFAHYLFHCSRLQGL